jgi:hypothetical protein
MFRAGSFDPAAAIRKPRLLTRCFRRRKRSAAGNRHQAHRHKDEGDGAAAGDAENLARARASVYIANA